MKLIQHATLQRIELTDEQFHKLNKADCELAIYISPEKISWCVMDSIHHRVVSLTNYQFAKEESKIDFWKEATALLAENKLEQQTFGSVKIAVDTGNNIFVPKELFVENKISEYLEFSVSSPEFPVKDFIENIQAYNIYGIPWDNLGSLRSMFEKLEVFHAATPFVSNLVKENRNLKENRLFSCLTGNILHIAAIGNGEFVFYNSYRADTKEDFCYYLLAVAEELSFHPEEIKVMLSGEITPDSEFYQTAKRFLKNITFADRPKALKYSSKLEAVPKHLHSLLYSIHLCESSEDY